MKKIVAILMVAALSFSMIACGNDAQDEDDEKSSGLYEIAMITDMGIIDDKSFNQGTWEGILAFSEQNDVTHKYYKPDEPSTDGYLRAINQAIFGGAKIIVTSGYIFQNAVFIAQEEHPDVKFILIDGNPESEDGVVRIDENTVGIVFTEEQSGYLAGYAAVKDGYTKLGFIGGLEVVPAVVKYGYGFVQGASAAAAELGARNVDIMYSYTDGFDATPYVEGLAKSWYTEGTEIIFGCGGALGNSVMKAAEEKDTKVIGVDVDQSNLSDTVITSAMKGLTAAVIQTLEEYYADHFPGGKGMVLGADKDGVKLPMETSKFVSFSQADYDMVYQELADGKIKIKKHDDATDVKSLGADNLKITFVE